MRPFKTKPKHRPGKPEDYDLSQTGWARPHDDAETSIFDRTACGGADSGILVHQYLTDQPLTGKRGVRTGIGSYPPDEEWRDADELDDE